MTKYDKIMDLQKQFTVTNEVDRKQFHFQSKDNSSTSYTVAYNECDSDENNAWIVLFKAVKLNLKICIECHQDEGHSIDCSHYKPNKVLIEASKIQELYSLVLDIQYLENLANVYPLSQEQNQELREKNWKIQAGIKNLI